MSRCSYIFPASPLTHPWHPNWLKVAASPLLGLLLPLLLHLPPLPKQLLLLPPSPSVTPWLQPGDGRRPGSGWVGVLEMRGSGRQGLVGEGRGRVPVLRGPPSSPKAAPVQEAKATALWVPPWGGSAEEGRPLPGTQTALERIELSSREKTWRKPKCILLSERSQSEKATYCMIPTSRHLEKAKLWRQKDQRLPGRGVGEDEWAEHRGFLEQ